MTQEELKTLYEKLSVKIPEEFLFKYEDGGKELTGYESQYAINLLNDIVGVGNWKTEEVINKQETLKNGWTCAMTLKLIINGCIEVTGYGGHYSSNIANAYKGAKTSAFKNACKYLGIGKELHSRGIDDDAIGSTQVAEDQFVDKEGLLCKIKSASTLAELEPLLIQINKEDGESVKKFLIKTFNDQKIKLT